MTPEQDAILRRIDYELMGPWADGRPSGWDTAIGPRTQTAMLVELTNALLGRETSRYPGSQVQVSTVDAIRDTNGLTYQLPQMINAVGQADPQAIANALRPVLGELVGPILHQAVTDALGTENAEFADAIVDTIADRLAR